MINSKYNSNSIIINKIYNNISNIISNNVNIDKLLSEYKSPPLIGLNNIGASNYLNSILQCLSQTKPLTTYFLEKSNEDRIINNNIALKNKNFLQLCPLYLELIKKLWDNNGNKSFSPYNFVNTLEKMNPLFKQGQTGDSKDFIIFILEQLHKELKSSNKTINTKSIKTSLNQYDKDNAFNHFFEEFQEGYSIISDVFFGINETTNICVNCKNYDISRGLNNSICYNYGIFNCLIFPLGDIKNLKNKSIVNTSINSHNCNNSISLYDCFLFNQKIELFYGDNQYYCNICKQKCENLFTTKIFASPKFLILLLNRGKCDIYNVKIDFTETLDITDFVSLKNKSKMIYNLYGVITHIGQSGPNAHFVASCKSTIDNKWYRFNDAKVSPINNVQKEVIDFGTPYILFYQKN